MLNRIIFFSLLFSLLTAKAQVVELYSGLQPSDIHKGDTTISIVIRNEGGKAVKFYPLTELDSAGNYLFLDEASYLERLGKIYQNSGQVPVLREFARIYKSPYFINNHLEYTAHGPNGFNTLIGSKQHSIIGSKLSVSNRQCGEYWRQFAIEAARAGIFSADSMRIVNCNAHVLGEVILNSGDTALVDLDPGAPRFLDVNAQGDIMSAKDVQAHPGLLDGQSPYAYHSSGEQKYLLPDIESATRAYKEIFSKEITYVPVDRLETARIEGAWTLCGECSISIDYALPQYFVDLSDPIKKYLWDTVKALIGTAEHNKSLVFLSELLGGNISDEHVIEAFKSQRVYFSETPFFKMSWINDQKFLKDKYLIRLNIPAVTYDRDLGSFPFLIHSISATDTLIVNGQKVKSARYDLWNDKRDSRRPHPPTVTDEMVNYLTSGTIPANTSAEILMYYNQYLYEFRDGIQAEMFGSEPQIVVETVGEHF